MPTYALRGRAFASPSVLLSLSITLAACGAADVGPSGGSLQIESSTPFNKQTGVRIDQPIEITFAEALVQDTVNTSNFMLMPGESGMADMADMDMDNMDHSQMDMGMSDMSVIAGKVECDFALGTECRTIKFTPTMSLAYGKKYHIMVHGVRTTSGKTIKGEHAVPLEFTTAYVVEMERERNIDALTSGRPERYRKSAFQYSPSSFDIPPMRISRTDTDSNGQTQTTLYNQTLGTRFGVDIRYKKGMTADPANIDRYTYALKDATGKTLASIVFDGDGGDGIWGNDNDTIRSFSIRGEEHHAAHHLTSIYSTEAGASITAPNPLTVQALKSNPGFTRVRGTLMIYDTLNGIRRMLKSIRFTSFGADKTPNVTAQGTMVPGSDDVLDEYQVYIYDTTHKTSRVGRKEFELDENSAQTLTLNEATDEAAGLLTGYRIYRTATTPSFGIAVGMLRVAEVTYKDPGQAGVWYNTPSNLTAEDDNIVRDIELNFYCNGANGLYEKYEIEVEINGRNGMVPGIGTYANITQFLQEANEQSYLANYCSNTVNFGAKPTQDFVRNNLGITNGVLEDVDTNEVK